MPDLITAAIVAYLALTSGVVALVAWRRGLPANTIAWLALVSALFGWTGYGWIAALLLAFMLDRPDTQTASVTITLMIR